MQPDIYEQLGVTPVVNALGNVTLLGGSMVSPGVQAAMQTSNQPFVAMEELLDKAGKGIADMLGAENAYVTSGAYAALVLSVATSMAGDDPEKIAQLPDTTGMKNEILIHKKTRYHYDRCVTTPGAKLVEVGDENGTTRAQMEAAIGPNTAGILYFARSEREPGVLSIPEMVEIAQAADIRLILDAAGEIYPLERMTTLPTCGADFVCFGAKYLGAPNSTGILTGKHALVEAAKRHSFIGYEAYRNRSVGRGYKLDRQEVIAVYTAVREWLEMDHEERLHEEARRIEVIQTELTDLPHVHAENLELSEGYAWMRLRVSIDEEGLGKSIQQVADGLKSGSPSVWVRVVDDDIFVVVNTLQEGEDEIVAQRLREELTATD